MLKIVFSASLNRTIPTLIHQVLVALACDLGLDTMPCCAEAHKWAWFRRYCSAARVAASIVTRSPLPVAFTEEVGKKILDIASSGESGSNEHLDHVMFLQEQDEQLLQWLNRWDWMLVWWWGRYCGGGTVAEVNTCTFIECHVCESMSCWLCCIPARAGWTAAAVAQQVRLTVGVMVGQILWWWDCCWGEYLYFGRMSCMWIHELLTMLYSCKSRMNSCCSGSTGETDCWCDGGADTVVVGLLLRWILVL